MSKFPIVPSVDLDQANSSDYASDSFRDDDFLDNTGDATMVEDSDVSDQAVDAASPADPDTFSAPLGSKETHAAIVWLYQELSNDILAHVKSSSFLQQVCMTYFLGAQEHLTQRLSQSQAQDNAESAKEMSNAGILLAQDGPLLQRMMSRLGYSQPYQDKLDNCRRLLNSNSLLRQFFLDGRHSLSCHLEHEPNIQNSLQQIVRQYAHYSLMDLHQFNVTLYNPQPQQETRHLDLASITDTSSVFTYIVAILLFFLLSGGGSYALLRIWFPDVLQNLLG